MSKYLIRPGVVLSSVCGEHLLIATREARGKCPYAKQINNTGAYFWTLLEQGDDVENMVLSASDRFQAEPERIRPGLIRFIESLTSAGYLIPEETE